MSELKPRMVCDLCRKGDGDNLCYAGGVDKCLKDGRYTKFELHRVQPANEPLTIEQLKQMDGEPVWCADGEGHSCYCLVNAESEDCIDSECGAWCFEFYGMTGDGENGLHNMGWLAYDHKQGGEQDG